MKATKKKRKSNSFKIDVSYLAWVRKTSVRKEMTRKEMSNYINRVLHNHRDSWAGFGE